MPNLLSSSKDEEIAGRALSDEWEQGLSMGGVVDNPTGDRWARLTPHVNPEQEEGHERTPMASTLSGANMSGKERIEVSGSKVYGPYSPGVKSYGIVWLAGQISPEAGDDIISQTRGSLAKIDALLAAAGLGKNDVTFAQVLLSDIDDFEAMNTAYSEWLEGVEIPPARAAFEAGRLPRDAKVEIVVQAVDSNCCD